MVWYTNGPAVRTNMLPEENPASVDAVLNATAEQAYSSNPLKSLADSLSLAKAEQGELIPLSGFRAPARRSPAASPLITRDDALAQAKAAGVSLDVPDGGMRQGAVDILLKRKQEERKRQEVLARSPGGFGLGAAQFGVNLAVSAIDPINLGSAFIPVVGELRYAALLAKAGNAAGRVAIRAGVGAAEGALGAVAVEPIVYGTQRYLQADYDMSDSLLNVAIGTVLGGGMHVVGGALKDRLGGTPEIERVIEPLPPQAKANLAAEAMSALIEGRAPRVAEMAQAVAAEQPPPRVPMRDADPANPRADIAAFVEASVGKSTAKQINTGTITPEITARIADKGVDVTGFSHVMQSDDIRHTLKRHGEGGNLRADELPVTPADIARVPDILADPATTIRREDDTHQGLPVLVFTKREGNTIVVVEEVRAKRQRMTFKSMRIKKAGGGGSPGAIDTPTASLSIRPQSLELGREPGSAEGNIGAAAPEGNPLRDWAPEAGKPIAEPVPPPGSTIDPVDVITSAAIDALPPMPKDAAELLSRADEALAAAEEDFKRMVGDQPDAESQRALDALKLDDETTQARIKAVDAGAACLIRAGA